MVDILKTGFLDNQGSSYVVFLSSVQLSFTFEMRQNFVYVIKIGNSMDIKKGKIPYLYIISFLLNRGKMFEICV